MSHRPRRFGVVLLGLGLMGTTAFSGPPGDGAKEPPLDPKIREFAGSYFMGGLGWNPSLTIQPDGHYAYQLQGCLGVYDTASGTARVEGEFLVFANEAPRGRGSTGPSACLPVRWGARRYLVPKDEIAAFCAAVNEGKEPRDINGPALYYLRSDKAASPKPAGLPDLPRPWRDLLKKKPGDGSVA